MAGSQAIPRIGVLPAFKVDANLPEHVSQMKTLPFLEPMAMWSLVEESAARHQFDSMVNFGDWNVDTSL